MKANKNGVILTPEHLLAKDFVKILKGITAKRPRTVINHILQFGVITTEELKEKYGYEHPPRAIRDVREQGIPLQTFRVPGKQGKCKIAAYTFGDPKEIKRDRIGGRKAFPKYFKSELISKYGSYDAFTREKVEAHYLQIDHRVPYEVAGDGSSLDVNKYMLLDASSQRIKSWSCEQCENFRTKRDGNRCLSCYWASPEQYTHISLNEVRRLDIVWFGEEVHEFDKIRARCLAEGISIQDFLKSSLRQK